MGCSGGSVYKINTKHTCAYIYICIYIYYYYYVIYVYTVSIYWNMLVQFYDVLSSIFGGLVLC